MARRILVLLGVLAVGLAWNAHADDAKKSDAESQTPIKKEDLTLKTEINARKFREFQQALLRLAQRLESSSKPEDKERAANIRKAIEVASTSAVDSRFDRLINILKTSKDLNLQEVNEAMMQNKMLVADIRVILQLLLSDNSEERRRAEMMRLTEIIKQLDKAIRDEKLNRARVEGGKTEKKDLSDAEKKNRQQVAQIGKALDKNAKGDKDDDGKKSDGKKGDAKNDKKKGDDKKGDSKKSDSKKGDSKKSDSKGDSKKGDSKKSDSKSGDKSGDSQPKDSDNEPQPNDKDKQQPQENTPGKKQIQEAQQFQKRAIDEIEKDEKEKASQQQSKAIEELEKARKKLEEILRQLREEEIERLLAALQQRCEQMLQMQIAVYNGTQAVDKAFGPSPDKESEANRGNVQKSIDLSKREGLIVEIANKCIQMLEADGSAVAFPEMFFQVRDDMKTVERRLGKADVGTVTQVIEQDIINNLKDMIEALKKAQQDQQNRRNNNNNNNNNRPQDQKLIDMLAELKMIRAMQVRVNSRTRVYADQYTGEQAAVQEIQKELANLAQRQQKIFEVTNNIWRGKNK